MNIREFLHSTIFAFASAAMISQNKFAASAKNLKGESQRMQKYFTTKSNSLRFGTLEGYCNVL